MRAPAGLGRLALASDWPRTTRLLPWSVAGFLAMIFLTPFDNTHLPIPMPLDPTLDRGMLIAICGLWAISASTPMGVRRLNLGPVHAAFGVFAVIAIASVVLGFDTLNRVGEADLATKKLALLFSYIVLFVIAASSLRRTEVQRLIAFTVGLASITAVGVIVEYRTGFNPFYTWGAKVLPGITPPPDFGTYDSIGRKTIVGPAAHPLAAAMTLAMVLPFAVTGMFRAETTRTRVLYGIASALLIGGALATQRKTALIVPAATLVVLAAYRPRLALKRLPLGLVVAAIVVIGAPGALKGVADQLKPSALTGVLSTQDRVSDYDAIKPDVVNHLLIGRGYDSYDQMRYRILDNQYLTLLVNVGFLGVFAFLALMFSGIRLAHRCARSRDPERAWFGPAAVAAIVGLTLGSALLDTLSYPQLPYLFCFIAAFATISARGLPSPRDEWREAQ